MENLISEIETKSKFYVPTPEEIREICLEIQATWSSEERRRRGVSRDNVARDEAGECTDKSYVNFELTQKMTQESH